MSAISEGMERVVEAIRRKGFPLNDSLRPGLSEQEIQDKVGHLTFPLPPEIVELYQWRNGQTPESQILLFRDQRFLSLDEALDDYQMIQTYFVPALGGVDVGVDLKSCFPFAGFEGANYVVPCRGQTLVTGYDLPVISVFEGIEVHFLSFRTMADTIVAWYEAGVHRVEDLFVDSTLELRIWKQHNPGLFEGYEFP
jgi:hypothetical protein